MRTGLCCALLAVLLACTGIDAGKRGCRARGRGLGGPRRPLGDRRLLAPAPALHQPLLHTNLPRPFPCSPAARELTQARAPAAEVAATRRQPTTTVRGSCRSVAAALELPPPIWAPSCPLCLALCPLAWFACHHAQLHWFQGPVPLPLMRCADCRCPPRGAVADRRGRPPRRPCSGKPPVLQ